MGFARLFRSRWAALLWAGGIVWTAVDVAAANGSGDPPAANASAAAADATGENVAAADLAVLANAGG